MPNQETVRHTLALITAVVALLTAVVIYRRETRAAPEPNRTAQTATPVSDGQNGADNRSGGMFTEPAPVPSTPQPSPTGGRQRLSVTPPPEIAEPAPARTPVAPKEEPPTEPEIPPARVGDFVISLHQCARETEGIICTMTVRNEGEDRSFRIYNSNTFIAGGGEDRKVKWTKVGSDVNVGRYSAAGRLIAAGDFANASVCFFPLPEGVSPISALHLSLEWLRPQRRAKIDFRNIPLSGADGR